MSKCLDIAQTALGFYTIVSLPSTRSRKTLHEPLWPPQPMCHEKQKAALSRGYSEDLRHATASGTWRGRQVQNWWVLQIFGYNPKYLIGLHIFQQLWFEVRGITSFTAMPWHLPSYATSKKARGSEWLKTGLCPHMVFKLYTSLNSQIRSLPAGLEEVVCFPSPGWCDRSWRSREGRNCQGCKVWPIAFIA